MLRRYDLKPYRYRGQRHTTVMVKVPESFVNDTPWPEHQQIASTLQSYIDQITERIVAEVIHADKSDAEEKRGPKTFTLPHKSFELQVMGTFEVRDGKIKAWRDYFRYEPVHQPHWIRPTQSLSGTKGSGRRVSAGRLGTAVACDRAGGCGGGATRLCVCTAAAGRGSPAGTVTDGPLGTQESTDCPIGDGGNGVAFAVAVALLVAAGEGSLSE